jgi:hypothetical protein
VTDPRLLGRIRHLEVVATISGSQGYLLVWDEHRRALVRRAFTWQPEHEEQT